MIKIEHRILLIEDDPDLREAIEETLRRSGATVVSVSDSESAFPIIQSRDFSLILSDVSLPGTSGIDFLKQIRGQKIKTPVLLMTAHAKVSDAVLAIKYGALNYLVKPFEAEHLILEIANILEEKKLKTKNLKFISEDPSMKKTMEMALKVAETDVTVLLTGESGVGKEVFARYIHESSARHKKPFVAINCAAIPETMLESILFGYEKGAFTGANQSTAGKFEQAQKGTLLLDEITEIPLGLQAKLLRVLQEREVERLGSSKAIPLDVRIIATSNRNLEEAVSSGVFREDLFYRIQVFQIEIPPLRQRKKDIIPLAIFFLEKHAERFGVVVPPLDSFAKEELLNYDWPGNVRELENICQRALILKKGDHISRDDLPFFKNNKKTKEKNFEIKSDLNEEMKLKENDMILSVLHANQGSRIKTAKELGISERTLRYKLAKMRETGLLDG